MFRCPNTRLCKCEEDTYPLDVQPLYQMDAKEFNVTGGDSQTGLWTATSEVAGTLTVPGGTGVVTDAVCVWIVCHGKGPHTGLGHIVKLWMLHYSPALCQRKQLNDPDIGPVLKWVESGKRTGSEDVACTCPSIQAYWLNWATLELRNGQSFHQFTKDEVLHTMHDSLLRPLEKLRSRFERCVSKVTDNFCQL